jgi:translation initiation factor IF-2
METQRQNITDIPQVMRLSKVAKEFNIGLQTIIGFLSKKAHNVEMNPNARITEDMYNMLVKEFSTEKSAKEESLQLELNFAKKELILKKDF